MEMSNDEYYKYFHFGENTPHEKKPQNSFVDEFMEGGENGENAENGESEEKDYNGGNAKPEVEPKEQSSDEIGKELLNDIINKQLDKEWDMEKIIMKYQLSPEQLDKILYESKAWESQIIGGYSFVEENTDEENIDEESNNEQNTITGGYIDFENLTKLVEKYLFLFGQSHDFLTRYLRTFQIISEVGDENKFLPRRDLSEKQNEEILSKFLTIIEEIRSSAEILLTFTNIKIDKKILDDYLFNTGIQHHNKNLTTLTKVESENAYQKFIKITKYGIISKRAFINEMYKYDLRDPKRFYSDGIHKNAINKYKLYKKFIESTTITLGENFLEILISIYKILTGFMIYAANEQKQDPAKISSSNIKKYIDNRFFNDGKYLQFLKEIKEFINNPKQRTAENSKKLIDENIRSFDSSFIDDKSNKEKLPALVEVKTVEKQEIIKEDLGPKCILPLEPNVSGYLNIADFIEEIKAPEKVEEKEEIKVEEKEEIKVEEKEEIKVDEKKEEKEIEINEFIEETKKDTTEDKQPEMFDIMHMITDPTDAIGVITPVLEVTPDVAKESLSKLEEKQPSLLSLPTLLPLPTLIIPNAPIAPEIGEFKKFVVKKPEPIPVPPIAPEIGEFKKFVVKKPQPVPVPPIAPEIGEFKKFVVKKPQPIPVPPPAPVIPGFKKIVVAPKPIAVVVAPATAPTLTTSLSGFNYGIAIKTPIDDSALKIPIEYRVLPKLSEKKDPYRVKVMFIIAYNILTLGEMEGKSLSDLAQHVNSFSSKTDKFLNDLILEYLRGIGFSYASDDALYVYVKYLKNGGVPLIAREDISAFVNAYNLLVEKIYATG